LRAHNDVERLCDQYKLNYKKSKNASVQRSANQSKTEILDSTLGDSFNSGRGGLKSPISPKDNKRKK